MAHQPRTAALLNMVRDGAIGDLRFIRASFSFSIDADDWRLDPARGGGALWDVGCYGVSTARLYAGQEPERIQALARFGSTGVDLSLTSELSFPNGVLANSIAVLSSRSGAFTNSLAARGSLEFPTPICHRPINRSRT